MRIHYYCSALILALLLLIPRCQLPPGDNQLVEKLDSIVSYDPDGNPTVLDAFTYDSNGYLLSHHSYLWFPPGEDTPREENFSYQYTYDEKGRMISMLNQIPEPPRQNTAVPEPSGQWLEEYGYDARGHRTITEKKALLPSSGEWMMYHREVSLFNPGGNMMEQTIYSSANRDYILREKEKRVLSDASDQHFTKWQTFRWNSTDEEWVVSKQIESLYENGNLTEWIEFSYSWRDTKWYPREKRSNTWDSRGRKTSSIRYNYYTGEEQWIPESQVEFTYHPTDSLHQEAASLWDPDKNEWKPMSTEVYSYDESGFLHTKTTTWHDPDRMTVAKKEEYSYTPDGHIARVAYYDKGDQEGPWKAMSKYEYSYNNRGNIVEGSDYYFDNIAEEWIKRSDQTTRFRSRPGLHQIAIPYRFHLPRRMPKLLQKVTSKPRWHERSEYRTPSGELRSYEKQVFYYSKMK